MRKEIKALLEHAARLEKRLAAAMARAERTRQQARPEAENLRRTLINEARQEADEMLREGRKQARTDAQAYQNHQRELIATRALTTQDIDELAARFLEEALR